MNSFGVESSVFGRIVVPEFLPRGKALFYTTADLHGWLDDDIAAQFRAFIKERFGFDATLATCTQVHSANVERVKHEPKWRECDSCDALWTADRHVALGIKVADCLPVSIVAREMIANIHSGWRGAVRQITKETIDAMPLDPAIAFAYLGPAIRVCCFEVGEEVAVQFPEAFVDRSHAKPHVDVAAFTVSILRERGFAPDRIFDSGLCTRCEGSIFHSFRRDGRNGGRNLALVAQ